MKKVNKRSAIHCLFNTLVDIVPLRHKNRVRSTQLQYMRLKRLAKIRKPKFLSAGGAA